MKPCKHIPIFKTNTNNKNIRARGQYLLELFPFVILKSFCIDSFINILKSHRWNFIKPCKHIPIFKTNTNNKNLRAKGPILLELFPFVILNGFCIDSFLNILKSHWWNCIKPCKHIPIFKTNTYNKNLRARGQCY